MNQRPTRSLKRRDGAGHLDPAYANKLRELSQQSAPEEDGTGFLSEARSSDSLAEELGESFVRAATSGEDDETDVRDRVVAESIASRHIEFQCSADPSAMSVRPKPRDRPCPLTRLVPDSGTRAHRERPPSTARSRHCGQDKQGLVLRRT